MTLIKQRYTELLSLTQLFLLREYSLTTMRNVDSNTFDFFQKKGKNASVVPSSKKTPAPISIPSPIFQSPKMPLRATSIPPSPDPRPPEIHPDPIPPDPLPPPAPPEPPSPDPKPPIIQDKVTQPKRHSKSFALEPLSEPPTSSLPREFWKIFPTLFSDLPLHETVPNDAMAQKIKNAWLNEHVIPPIVLLSFQEGEKQLALLKNIAQAISLHLAPARVFSAFKIEQDKGWEKVLKSPSLQLVIASDYGLYMQPNLLPFYREMPQQGKHFLNHIPLLLLSDLSLYLKEPQLKALLWRAICNEFAAARDLSNR